MLKLEKGLSPLKVLIPTALGLGIILFLYLDDLLKIQEVQWSSKAISALGVALGLILVRDAAYIYRIKILSLGEFNWKSSFNIVMLWEFASAVTPSVVGGSAVASLILKREGMSLGRSVATVLASILLDELFYVLAVPVVVLLASSHAFFPTIPLEFRFEYGILGLFWMGYFLICSIFFILIFAIFLAPKPTHNVFKSFLQLPLIRKWEKKGGQLLDDLLIASENIKGSSIKMWMKAVGATLISWTARFLTLNAILYAFLETVPNTQVFARQLGMWIVMLLSPTPGASGIAEFALPIFMEGVVDIAAIGLVVLVWRTLTSFIYLIIGTIIFPRWMIKTGK